MIVVVGGGVVGLATARALLVRRHEVCLLEAAAKCGRGGSTHNSGVIHAGLYYPAGTLKARLCVEGRDRLYAFAAQAHIPHVRCGKLIVAPREGQHTVALERVLSTAQGAGARLESVDAAFIAAREPHVAAGAGLWSPDTGWIDADAYIRALEADIAREGGAILTGTPLVAAEPAAHGLTVVTPRERIEATCLVNAAGLEADAVAARSGGESFRIYPCRGEYAELA